MPLEGSERGSGAVTVHFGGGRIFLINTYFMFADVVVSMFFVLMHLVLRGKNWISIAMIAALQMT